MKVRYTGAESEVEAFGSTFTDGDAVEVADIHYRKVKGNQFFDVVEPPEGYERQTTLSPTLSQFAEALAQKQRHEDAETVRIQTEQAAKAKAYAEKEAADRAKVEAAQKAAADAQAKADDQASSSNDDGLKAVHRGRGKYSIMRGDTELKDGLSKEDADKFNALSDEEKQKQAEA